MTVGFTDTYPAEAADPYCLSPEQADELLAGAPWRRFVVLGDSIAEGIREEMEGFGPDPWADRVADALRRQQPDLLYENLGVMGLRAAEVRAWQLDRALELEPDLGCVICGGNDLLVRRFDGAAVEEEIDTMVGALRDTGADVITYTMYDIHAALDMPPEFGKDLRDRLDDLFERMRSVARRHDTLHVELAPHPSSAQADIYASDFQHCSTRGHAICASLTIERLGAALAERREREKP